jgi:hypothetical protein
MIRSEGESSSPPCGPNRLVALENMLVYRRSIFVVEVSAPYAVQRLTKVVDTPRCHETWMDGWKMSGYPIRKPGGETERRLPRAYRFRLTFRDEE